MLSDDFRSIAFKDPLVIKYLKSTVYRNSGIFKISHQNMIRLRLPMNFNCIRMYYIGSI